MSQTEIFVCGSAWSLFCGVVGWLGNAWFSRQRDKADRLRKFIFFLSAWRTDIERIHPDNIDSIWQAFVSKVSEFAGHYSNIRRDIWRKTAFDDIANPLRSLQGDEIRNPTTPDRRDMICGKIDRLKLFLGAKK